MSEPLPDADDFVPLAKVREALKVAFKAGWVSRDLRGMASQRWTQYTDPRTVKVLNVEGMMEEDYAEFLAEVRSVPTEEQIARSVRRHPSNPERER